MPGSVALHHMLTPNEYDLAELYVHNHTRMNDVYEVLMDYHCYFESTEESQVVLIDVRVQHMLSAKLTAMSIEHDW